MSKGSFGESFANTLIGMWTRDGELFETVAVGEKWPVIDIYAETKTANGHKIFCFFQVKSTISGYTQRERKLKVQIDREHLNELANFNAPTYLIGVDYNKQNPILSAAYIKIIRGTYQTGISSMETTKVLNEDNLIILKSEVETFWSDLNPLNDKILYPTSF
jgi:hypothetical protein